MNAELNTKLKVFSKLYVGFQSQGEDRIPLGFATPYEDNAAGRKRMGTVDQWASGYSYRYKGATKPEAKILDNVARSGFKITDNIRRIYWGGGNVVFRVEDPYGYELEIPSQNLMALLSTCGIQPGGIVPGKCVWGRDGGTNVLLHEDSAEYKNALHGAESLKRTSAGSRIIGTEYVLQNGSIATYLGKLWVTYWSYSDSSPTNILLKRGEDTQPGKADAKRISETVQYDAVIDINDKTVTFYKKAPLVKLHKEGSISAAKAEHIAQKADNKRFASDNVYGSVIDSVKIEKPNDLIFGIRPLTEREFRQQLKRFDYRLSQVTDKESKTAADLGLFEGYPEIIGLRHDGHLFTHSFAFHKNVSSSPSPRWNNFRESQESKFEITPCLGVIELREKDLYVYYGEHNYGWNYRFGLDHHKSSTSYTVEVYPLPQYRTVKDVITWAEAQFEAGNLFKIGLEEKAG